MKYSTLAAFSAVALVASAAFAAEPAKLTIKVEGIEPGQPIPAKYAFCKPDGKGKTNDAPNISPAISWSKVPEGTKSFALVVVDRDVPETFESANKDTLIMTEKFPRQNFYHLVLADIPATVTSIPEGALSKGIIKEGKPTGKGEFGVSGKNDYSRISNTITGGYDGPCPPWNDARLHNYHFIVFALGVDTLNPDSKEPFSGQQLMDAMGKYILAKGTVSGTYTTNPDMQPKKK